MKIHLFYYYFIIDIFELHLTQTFETIGTNIVKLGKVTVKSCHTSMKEQRDILSEIDVNVKSNMDLLVKGVPQCSILGSLLYILYTNEFTKNPRRSCMYVMYADNISLIVNGDDEGDIGLMVE